MARLPARVRDWMSGANVPAIVLWPAILSAIGLMMLLHVVNVGLLNIDPIPDLLHPATPQTLAETLKAMGPQGRSAYLMTAWLDWLFPPAYAIAISGTLALLKPRDRWTVLPWLPVIAMGFDLLENTLFIALVAEWLPWSGAPLYAAAGANAVKWLFADLSMLAIPAILAWRLGHDRRARP